MTVRSAIVIPIMAPMDPADLRRGAAGHRLAAERQREQAAEHGFVPDSIRAALDLIAVAGHLQGCPPPRDPVTERDEQAREGWSRLRGALSDALAAAAVPGMVIGGVAVIARGVPRQTIDIDATLWAKEATLGDLLSTFADHQIVPRVSDVEELARRSQVLLI